MGRRTGNCTVKPGVRRRTLVRVMLAALGLVLGLTGMLWLGTVQGTTTVLSIMNGMLLGSLLAAVLAGQVDRWTPPGS